MTAHKLLINMNRTKRNVYFARMFDFNVSIKLTATI